MQTGLASGKEIVVHQNNLKVNGWTGAGYIIYDPVVGDGGYRISGGVNGGLIEVLTLLNSLFSAVSGTAIAATSEPPEVTAAISVLDKVLSFLGCMAQANVVKKWAYTMMYLFIAVKAALKKGRLRVMGAIFIAAGILTLFVIVGSCVLNPTARLNTRVIRERDYA